MSASDMQNSNNMRLWKKRITLWQNLRKCTQIAKQDWIWTLFAGVLSWEQAGPLATPFFQAVNSGSPWRRPGPPILRPPCQVLSDFEERDSVQFLESLRSLQDWNGREVVSEGQTPSQIFAGGSWNPWDKQVLGQQLAEDHLSMDLWVEFPKWIILQFSQIKTKMQLNFMSFIHPCPLCRH